MGVQPPGVFLPSSSPPSPNAGSRPRRALGPDAQASVLSSPASAKDGKCGPRDSGRQTPSRSLGQPSGRSTGRSGSQRLALREAAQPPAVPWPRHRASPADQEPAWLPDPAVHPARNWLASVALIADPHPDGVPPPPASVLASTGRCPSAVSARAPRGYQWVSCPTPCTQDRTLITQESIMLLATTIGLDHRRCEV